MSTGIIFNVTNTDKFLTEFLNLHKLQEFWKILNNRVQLCPKTVEKLYMLAFPAVLLRGLDFYRRAIEWLHCGAPRLKSYCITGGNPVELKLSRLLIASFGHLAVKLDVKRKQQVCRR